MSEKDINSWYIFRIAYRKEKKVKDILEIAGIENFIPFHVQKLVWNGNQKGVEVPLYPGIGFACVSDFDLVMLKMVHEISLFIQAEGNYLIVSDEQMQIIKDNPSSFPDEIFETVK